MVLACIFGCMPPAPKNGGLIAQSQQQVHLFGSQSVIVLQGVA